VADVEDFEVFARDAYGRLVGVLSLYCGDAGAAEELAHEALVRARLHWSRVRRMDSPQGWLHRVGINLAHSWFRRRAAERRALQRRAVRDAAAVNAPGPDAVVEAMEVREALAGLSGRQRQALVLRYFLDWSVADTASTMGVSEGAVKSYCHRGLATLRERLGHDVEVGR
jgi:RNA polymerase sigma-70 factor (sigma-E family)